MTPEERAHFVIELWEPMLVESDKEVMRADLMNHFRLAAEQETHACAQLIADQQSTLDGMILKDRAVAALRSRALNA